MQVKIGFGFLILTIAVLGFLLWRANRNLKGCKAQLPATAASAAA